MSIVRLCFACAFLAAPAWAADDITVSIGPPLTVHFAPALEQSEKTYKAAVDALTPDQQATLKSYQSQYIDLIKPEIQLLKLEYQIKFCLSQNGSAFAKNGANYQADYFESYQDALLSEDASVKALRAKQIRDTAFIDQKLIDGHIDVMDHLTLALGRASMDADFQKGAFANTDCNATAHTLLKMHTAIDEKQTKAIVANLKTAAASGDPVAMSILSKMMMEGTNGFAKNYDAGLALLVRAANTGDASAEASLGSTLAADVYGRTPDKAKAKYWLAKAAAQGDKDAAKLLPEIDKLPASESTQSLSARAAKGDAEAEYELAARYAHGWNGVAKDPAKALELMLASAGQGNVSAQADAALLLFSVNRISEGLEYLTKAAEAGNANSQISLAGLYVDGTYMPRDVAKARYWYGKAAAQGDPRGTDGLQRLGAN